MKYRVIDAHTHVFPDKIAEKAAASICNFYEFELGKTASLQQLLSCSDEVEMSNFLVCSAALSPQQTRQINDFMHTLNQEEKLVALGSIHPEFENWEEELERIKALGLHGIKLHSDFQEFPIDQEGMIPKYKKMAKLGLPVLFHMGDPRYDYSAPERLLHVMEQVPDLVCIAAHMGGYCRWEEAYQLLPVEDRLYFDTSSALAFLEKDQMFRMFEKHGVEKFMFGTDFPIWSVKAEYDNLLNLGLSQEENQKIFADNFCRLFQID